MKIRLFIADADPDFLSAALARLSHCPDIDVAGYAANGVEALRQIARLRPQVLLTDLQLPGMDGVALIEETKKLNPEAMCVACTRFRSDLMMDAACLRGACCFLYKPIDLERLPLILRQCRQSAVVRREAPARRQDADARLALRTRALLQSLGFSPRMQGSLYITAIVLRASQNESLLNNLSKGLYAELAARLRTTPQRIERSLRTAVGCACERGRLGEIFPERPSNRVFLRYLMDRLREGSDSQTV